MTMQEIVEKHVRQDDDLTSLLLEARNFIRVKTCHYSGDRLVGDGVELVEKIDEALERK